MFDYIWLVKIGLFLFLYILLPGFLISVVIFRRYNLFEMIGNSFAFGFIVFSIIVLFGYLFELNLLYIHYSMVVIDILLVLFYFNNFKRIKFVFDNYLVVSVFVFIAIMGFLISLFSGYSPRGDASIHMHSIIDILIYEKIKHPVYALLDSPIILDHMLETYYYLIALISKYTKLEVSITWHYLSPILALILPFTLYSFFKNIVKDRKLMIFLIVSFFLISVFLPNLQYGTVYDALVYPNRIYLWLILPISLSFFIKYLKTNRYTYLIISVLICVLQIFIHQEGFLAYLWIIGGVMVLSFLKKYKKISIKSTIIIFSTILIASPFLIFKIQMNTNFIEKASDQIWLKHYKFYFINDYLYAFPFHKFYPITAICALFITLIFIIFFKDLFKIHKYLILIFASSIIIPFLVIFNPFIVPFLGKIISYVAIGRMHRIPMYFLIYGFLFYMIYKFIIHKFRLTSNLLFNVILFLLITFAFYGVYLKINSGNINHEILNIAEISKKNIKNNSKILSDLQTSSDIVSFLPAKALAIRFNGAIDIVDISKEKDLINKILIKINSEKENDELEIIEIINNIKILNIDFIVINNNLYKLFTSFENLKKYIDIEILYSDENYSIIKIGDFK